MEKIIGKSVLIKPVDSFLFTVNFSGDNDDKSFIKHETYPIKTCIVVLRK